MAEFNFENFNQLNGFVTNEIIPSCKQFDSQISELETKIKDCVTVQSMSGNQDIYLGNPNLKKANTTQEFNAKQIKEFIKCKQDPIYFARNYIKIVSLDEG